MVINPVWVVRKLDGAIHRIVIFKTFKKCSVTDLYSSFYLLRDSHFLSLASSISLVSLFLLCLSAAVEKISIP